MQPNELKALLTATNEVAIKPVHVEVNVDNNRGRKYGPLICPTGLVKAKVIEDGYHWTERRPLSQCGDRDYEIPRRNGVLVEIDPDDLEKGAFKIVGKRVFRNGSKTPYPHAEVITKRAGEFDRLGKVGKKYIRLVTSRKAIFSAWDEYALEIAKREKIQAEQKIKRDLLRDPQAALMGMTREEFEKRYINGDSNRERYLYLGADWIVTETLKDTKGNTVWADDAYGHPRPVPVKEIGKIEITIDQATAILALLTPKQKNALKHV